MKRAGIAVTIATMGALVACGAALAQTASSNADRGWTHMMMGPMAGCPMGAGNQEMLGPYMMGQDMVGRGHTGQWNQGAADIGPQLTRLHHTLRIRREQQDEWNAYASAAISDSQTMFEMHKRMLGFMQSQATSGPEWLRVHRDMMRARSNSLDTLAGTLERFYGELDTSQRATFDRYGGGMCGGW